KDVRTVFNPRAERIQLLGIKFLASDNRAVILKKPRNVADRSVTKPPKPPDLGRRVLDLTHRECERVAGRLHDWEVDDRQLHEIEQVRNELFVEPEEASLSAGPHRPGRH